MTEAQSIVEAIANAPGTIPAAKVEERSRALAHQFRHDNYLDPLAPRAHEPVTVTAMAGSDYPLRRAEVFFTLDGSEPSLSSNRVAMEPAEVTWDVLPGYVTQWKAVLPGDAAGTIVRYRIGGWRITSTSEEPDSWARDGSGFWGLLSESTGISTFAYEVDSPACASPAWMEQAVIYQIFLDRFHPGTPDGRFQTGLGGKERHGGNLRGVIEALPYLTDLGINCIWLSPIHPSDTYHRYDTKDYFGIDPALGNEQDLHELTDSAHAAGMRVLLDFVPSHSSWRHPAFLEAQRDRSAPTFSWYTFEDWPDRYRCFLQVSKHLPSLNSQDPSARRHLIDAARYWLQTFGIDGFRLDHAIGAGMDFWVAFQNGVVDARGDVVTIAEATDTPDYLRHYRGRLNCILDFELAATLRLGFGQGAVNVRQLEAFIGHSERFMGEAPARVSFLDNHDMDRFLWIAGNDVRRLQLAALCQFTQRATPVIYYGTEIGMTQENGATGLFGGDEEARRDMVWESDLWNRNLRGFYRRLVNLRKSHRALSVGQRLLLHLDPESSIWVYQRSHEESGDKLVAAFNLGAESQTVSLDASEDDSEILLAAGDAKLKPTNALELGPMSGALLSSR